MTDEDDEDDEYWTSLFLEDLIYDHHLDSPNQHNVNSAIKQSKRSIGLGERHDEADCLALSQAGNTNSNSNNKSSSKKSTSKINPPVNRLRSKNINEIQHEESPRCRQRSGEYDTAAHVISNTEGSCRTFVSLPVCLFGS
jgi:hypothetical protein